MVCSLWSVNLCKYMWTLTTISRHPLPWVEFLGHKKSSLGIHKQILVFISISSYSELFLSIHSHLQVFLGIPGIQSHSIYLESHSQLSTGIRRYLKTNSLKCQVLSHDEPRRAMFIGSVGMTRSRGDLCAEMTAIVFSLDIEQSHSDACSMLLQYE